MFTRGITSQSEKAEKQQCGTRWMRFNEHAVDIHTVSHYPFYVKLHRITFVVINGFNAFGKMLKSIKTVSIV